MRVDQKRIRSRLEQLAEIGLTPSGGWTRLSFTPEDFRAREVVSSFMREAGMTVRTDAAGNLIGRLDGLCPTEPPVACGSHIDTVFNGGMFDGAMGVMLGIEVAQIIHCAGARMKRPLEVIVFADEEGARFGSGLLGSRAMVGKLNPADLHSHRDRDGITIAQAMEKCDLDPDQIAEARRQPGSYRAYLEVHAEQGRVLEDAGLPVGVVTAISAPVWLECTIKGRADHAGATPMDMRRDALVAACAAALEVQRLARNTGGAAVATVGRMEVLPGGINIIPGEVRFTVDIRHVLESRRELLVNEVRGAVVAQAHRCECLANIKEIMRVQPVQLNPMLQELLIEQLRSLSIPHMSLVSGASHDGQVMAEITDVGMLFVKSKGGLSHCPDEASDWENIALAGEALLAAVERLMAE